MISQEITYEDYDGKEVTKTFWFHLNKLDFAEVHIQDDFNDILSANDATRSLRAMKRILRYAVVQRVGDKVIKPEDLGDEFVASDAYSAFILSLMNDENGAERMRKFIMGVAPFVAKANAPQDHQPKKITKESE